VRGDYEMREVVCARREGASGNAHCEIRICEMRNAINQWGVKEIAEAGLLITVAINNPTLRVNTSRALFRKIRVDGAKPAF
jgi:hypothetical protein